MKKGKQGCTFCEEDQVSCFVTALFVITFVVMLLISFQQLASNNTMLNNHLT